MVEIVSFSNPAYTAVIGFFLGVLVGVLVGHWISFKEALKKK